MMDKAEYCRLAAEALRSSERMMQRQLGIFKSTPEGDGQFYDPDWNVQISQDQAAVLISNLKTVAEFLDLLRGVQ
jgi:hypothetical protein